MRKMICIAIQDMVVLLIVFGCIIIIVSDNIKMMMEKWRKMVLNSQPILRRSSACGGFDISRCSKHRCSNHRISGLKLKL